MIFPPVAALLSARCVTFDADWLLDSTKALSVSGDAPIYWPAFRDAWLSIAHGVAQSGLPTVLFGPLIPEHLNDLPSRRWIGDLHFVVLDCSDSIRRSRLEARPVWRSRDVEEQVRFGHWLRDNIRDRIDTDNASPEATARAVADWVTTRL